MAVPVSLVLVMLVRVEFVPVRLEAVRLIKVKETPVRVSVAFAYVKPASPPKLLPSLN